MKLIATFSATGSTSNSISTAITGMSTSFAEQRNYEWYLNSSLVGTSSTPAYAGEAYYTFYGLASNTWYHFDVKIFGANNNLLTSLATDGQTQPSPRPSNWSWTTAELNAFNNKGALTTVTYTRWNTFIDKVNEFRSYKGWANVSSSAYMTSTDKVLTATRFNLVRTAIGEMYSTGISNVSTGNIIYGSYFITMANSLNSIT